ncbi:ATP-binding protein [Coleofasciculus sp. FACHB-SPT9]|uniref:ATP-binding protein n=1 Tax=Cyanophyceae TaxID=3028117 RepID=UPI0016864A61|nr:ATP-binding protein [Coleofasciculus sp. FACHB-SPT9]MBD1891952.1 response regulator [Coleofasciculus sp. FACHB-SPT9]
MTNLLTIEIRFEQDVVMTRQQARQIAQALGFDSQDQTRIATAVSEIARNAFQYTRGGKIEFRVEGELPQSLVVCIRDQGPGIANLKSILDGQYKSKTGMGLGIIGTKRLMDRFHIASTPGQGTEVLMEKTLPKRAPSLTAKRLAQIADELAMRGSQNPFEEIQQQNQELLRTLAELEKRQAELAQVNRELEDTNRGVVALYAELDEKAVSLQRANELKTRFLSNMSHEFRTPLNSIMSLSRLLLDRMDGELTPDQEQQVTFIRQSAEGLSELVNDLLDLAKVEAGKIVVHPNAFEVSELFATLRGMLRPLLSDNSSISLVFEEPVGFPPLCTDEGKVAQILRNFISNALKYTERGEVRIRAELDKNAVVFSVADTGIGIAPEDTERIFEEFIQVNSHLQKRVKGTGLGLPLSRKLAELLGGSVSIKSLQGVGSTFFATIPLIYRGEGDIEEVSEPDAPLQLDATRYPVLVVEDNPETLFIYEKYFAGSSYQIIPARSLKQVKQAFQMFEPRAVLLDILLEEQNTWDFLSEMKGNASTRDIPIVVITVIDNEKKARALGADAFFVKPVERLSLLEKLNTLVKQEHLQKVLIIDDDPASHYLLKQYLADFTGRTTREKCFNFKIIEATSGDEGIRHARLENPSCIFLDLVMPDMSGFEVLEQMKADPATKNIPVIINTSKLLEPEERSILVESTVAILSKENSSREEAIALVREALLLAGLVLEPGEAAHV